MAEYSIEVRHPDKLIVLVASGKIDLSVYKEAAEAVTELINKHKYNVFYDLFSTRLDFNAKTLAQAPRTAEGRNTPTAHEVYIAAFVNKRDSQRWKFIEIQLRAMGFHGKVFTSKDEAFSWLAENTGR